MGLRPYCVCLSARLYGCLWPRSFANAAITMRLCNKDEYPELKKMLILSFKKFRRQGKKNKLIYKQAFIFIIKHKLCKHSIMQL